ncbi:MAG: flagellar biosynthesis anti-sigma factor FlgM [Chitinispirillales bacterium]|jgi:anti-sigma28 factor (negative regulator of flagellin synthesis)|nr:flagellar biosynthesis anti-sigma factor FlgM [Chitinispirillales bacterium]
MQISKISQAMHSELRKVDGSRKPEKEQPTAKAVSADRSELSADGQKQREIKGEMQIISSMVKAQPDVRADKVAEARTKIGMGFYSTEAFAEKLASKLAQTFA